MVRLGASDFWTASSKCANIGDGLVGIGFQDGFSDCLYERHRRQRAPHNNARSVWNRLELHRLLGRGSFSMPP